MHNAHGVFNIDLKGNADARFLVKLPDLGDFFQYMPADMLFDQHQ